MQEKGISQEGLKVIACLTMLIDHIAASGVHYAQWMRIVGRIAFPIFCFLTAEGVARTRNPKKYALRLVIAMVLSELPFDLAFSIRWTWESQSVMVTILLGFLALEAMGLTENFYGKLLLAMPFCILGKYLKVDYGGYGVLMIVMFGLTRGLPREKLMQCADMAILCWAIGGRRMVFLGISMPTEMAALIALVPIFLYSGRKLTHSKAVQWGFYLFYPVHLTLLWAIRYLQYGF